MSKSNGRITDFWKARVLNITTSQASEKADKSLTSNAPLWTETVDKHKRRRLSPPVEQHVSSSKAAVRERSGFLHEDKHQELPTSSAMSTCSTTSNTEDALSSSPENHQADSAVKAADAPGADERAIGSSAKSTGWSFTSAVSSVPSCTSKRTVTSEGVEAVGDSSSGSETDSSLEDLASLVSQIKSAQPHASSHLKQAGNVQPSSRLQSLLSRPSGSRAITGSGRGKSSYDLVDLAAKSELAAARESRLHTLTARLQDDGPPRRNEEIASDSGAIQISEKQLTAVADLNGPNVDRVWQAMLRTEALQQDLVWRMFSEVPSTYERRKFPVNSFPRQGWLSGFRSSSRRESPHMWYLLREVGLRQRLPSELVQWMFQEIACEESEDLVAIYIDIIVASLNSQDISPDALVELFRRLGGIEITTDITHPIEPRMQISREANVKLHENLRFAIDLVRKLSFAMDFDTRLTTTSLLLRMSLDQSVSADNRLPVQIQRTVSRLLETTPETERKALVGEVSRQAFKLIRSPILQERLIDAIPCIGRVSHRLHRQVALAFALEDSAFPRADCRSSECETDLLQHLATSKFTVKQGGNYAELTARINIVDAAIDCGFSHFDRFEHGSNPTVQTIGSSGTSNNKAVTKESQHNLFDSPRPLPTDKQMIEEQTPKKEEQRYDKWVDAVATRLHEIAGKIRITGAMNIRGVEARAAAERLALRLEAGVRTKPKARRDAFARNGDISAMLQH